MLLNGRALYISLTISCIFHVLLLVSFASSTSSMSIINFSLNESVSNTSIMRVELRETKVVERKKGLKPVAKKQVNKYQKKNLSTSKRASGQNSLLAKYTSEVRNIIQKNQIYPAIARRLRMEGRVKLKFEIQWPNRVMNIEFADKSEFELLNKSAKKTLDKIENFPAIPEKLEVKSVKVVVPINYEI